MSAAFSLVERVRNGFADRFGGAPSLMAYAPGRVNLIGEHTDYNDGFVLPCAIDRGTLIAARPRDDATVRVLALDLGEEDSFALDGIAPSEARPWSNYIRGVAALLGSASRGVDLAVAGDVPKGGGLSSSASLEIASGRALAELWGLQRSLDELALIGQRAEHEYAGCKCGIMDQLVSARAEAGAALLIDCRSLACEAVPIAPGTMIMVVDSGVQRGLVDSAYNERRRQCEAAARHYGVPALRDLDLRTLEAGRQGLDPTSFARARHVVTENARTLAAGPALGSGDLIQLRELMAQSHASMRDDFEITVPAIDRLVAIAQQACGEEGGARMTGGGFGGCIVVVGPEDREQAVREAIEAQYRSPEGRQAEILVIRPSAGVALL